MRRRVEPTKRSLRGGRKKNGRQDRRSFEEGDETAGRRLAGAAVWFVVFETAKGSRAERQKKIPIGMKRRNKHGN